MRGPNNYEKCQNNRTGRACFMAFTVALTVVQSCAASTPEQLETLRQFQRRLPPTGSELTAGEGYHVRDTQIQTPEMNPPPSAMWWSVSAVPTPSTSPSSGCGCLRPLRTHDDGSAALYLPCRVYGKGSQLFVEVHPSEQMVKALMADLLGGAPASFPVPGYFRAR